MEYNRFHISILNYRKIFLIVFCHPLFSWLQLPCKNVMLIEQKEVLTSALIDCAQICTFNLLLSVNKFYFTLCNKEDLLYKVIHISLLLQYKIIRLTKFLGLILAHFIYTSITFIPAQYYVFSFVWEGYLSINNTEI